MDLSNQRREYSQPSIDPDLMDPCPIRQFDLWFREACESAAIVEPNAMVLSTVDEDQRPSSRSVLLKLFDDSGFVFFTNTGSRKARQISGNQNVALLFPWYGVQRQVEINGVAERVSAGEAMRYFALRPRGSQLGAWVSMQSSVVPTLSILHNTIDAMKRKFSSGSIPMPPSWGGYRVKPHRIEFWQGGVHRLHDRIQYTFSMKDQTWHCTRLAP
ncbi:MAG: pyridoxamine 5'-phosphate oxidase [Pirellulaceae bacterium]